MAEITTVLATPASSGLAAIDLRIALQDLGAIKEVVPRQNGASFRVIFLQPVLVVPAEKTVKNIRVKLQPDIATGLAKGTVYSKELEGCSAETVRSMITSSAVTNIECVPTRFRETASGRYRVTFSTTAPQSITLNCGLCLTVRALDPLPLRCTRCFEYWHHVDRCSSKVQLCDVCGLPAHPTKACKRTFCVACKAHGHSVKSTECPKWLQAKETARIRRQEEVPLGDAIKKAAALFPKLAPAKGKPAVTTAAPKSAPSPALTTTPNPSPTPQISYAATLSPPQSSPAGAAPSPASKDSSTALLEIISTMQKQMDQQQAIILRLEKLLVQQSVTTAKLVEQNSTIMAALSNASAPAKVPKRGRPAKTTSEDSPDSQRTKRMSTIPRMFLSAAQVDSDDTVSPCPSPSPMIVDLGEAPKSQPMPTGTMDSSKIRGFGEKNGSSPALLPVASPI